MGTNVPLTHTPQWFQPWSQTAGGLLPRHVEVPQAPMLEAVPATVPQVARSWGDARVVVRHRDPIVLCASACSLISTLTSTFTDRDHTSYIAEHATSMLAESVARIEAFPIANPGAAVVDVQYADLVRDPLNHGRGDLRCRRLRPRKVVVRCEETALHTMR